MTTGSRWASILLGIWLLAFSFTAVSGQCQSAQTKIYTVKEDDPAGTEILSVSATGGATWRYAFTDSSDQELEVFLNFSRVGNVYTLALAKPLDLEELRDDYDISDPAILLTLFCSEPSLGEVENRVILTSTPVNEFPPEFNTTSIQVYVKETTSNITVVNLAAWASDNDNNPITIEISGFSFLEPLNPLFGMSATGGRVFTRGPLDYESLPDNQKYLEIGVVVKDVGAKSGTATLTVHVADVDDLPPRFTYPGCPDPCSSVYYRATFSANVTGKLSSITPAAIQAEDGDAIGSTVSYTIRQGPDGYADYISMNPTTAEVTILKPLYGLQTETASVVLLFQAKENTPTGRFTSTSLLISVQGGAGPIPLASAGTDGNDIVIVGVVMGIIVFIILAILILAIIYYRKRFRKIIHPHNGDTEERGNDGKSSDQEGTRTSTPAQELPRPAILSDEEMKVDEEITTWLPANHLSDIVDLSDEDTLKMKKKNGVAPNSTTMTSRDSAFEESSDKKSGSSEDSHSHHQDPDFDPVTEYAEVGMTTHSSNESRMAKNKPLEHVYVPDPTTTTNISTTTTAEHQQQQSRGSIEGTNSTIHNTTNVNDSGVEEAEYLTPNSTRVKLRQSQGFAYNNNNNNNNSNNNSNIHKVGNQTTPGTDPDTSIYSDLIYIDDDRLHNASVGGQDSLIDVGVGISTGAAAHVQHLRNGDSFASSSPKPKSHHQHHNHHHNRPHRSKKSSNNNNNKQLLLSNSRQSLSDDAELTEYSTPRSEKSNRGVMSNSTRRFNDEEVLSPQLSTINDDADDDDDDDERPEVPPRPKIRQVSGLRVKDSDKSKSKSKPKSDEVHYASIQKKSSRKHNSSSNNNDNNNKKKEKSEKDAAQHDPRGQNHVNDNNDNDDGDDVDDNNSSKDNTGENKIDPPLRLKRHRKRSKQQVKAPEEDVYDGTKDYEDLEMDPDFYLDTNKTRVKRSSRLPATHIDPDDTQYWITVTDDY